MTAKVINDPAALGWEFDPDTGRWTWGGSDGGSSGGGGTPFPEAPLDGNQYGRQNRSWTEIVHPDGGGPATITTANVLLENPTRLPSGLVNQQDANSYISESLDKLIDEDGNVIKGGIEEAPSDSSIYGRKNEGWVVVPTGGGGGGDVDLSGYYTAAQCDSKYEPKFTKNTAFNKNFGSSSTTVAQGNHNHAGVYEPVFSKNTAFNKNFGTSNGTVAQGNHNHTGVYAAASHTHSYAPIGASYTKSESDNKYQPKGSSSTWDGEFIGAYAQFFTSDQYAGLRVTGPNAAMRLRVATGNGKTLRVAGNRFDILSDNYAVNVFNVADDAKCYATDFIAASDRNLKHDIETAPIGVLEKLRGVTFKWNDSGKESSGVIAQEMQDAGLGHLVSTNEGTGNLSVSYAGLTGYLIEELKALRKEVEALKK